MFNELVEREPRDWSYAELKSASDVVVIARFLSWRAAKDHPYRTDFEYSKDEVEVVVSTFEIVMALSGSIKDKTIDLVHLRNKNQQLPQGTKAGHPRFPVFEKSIAIPGNAFVLKDLRLERMTTTIAPEYLLFIKRRGDRLYSLTSADKDSVCSVRALLDIGYLQLLTSRK